MKLRSVLVVVFGQILSMVLAAGLLAAFLGLAFFAAVLLAKIFP